MIKNIRILVLVSFIFLLFNGCARETPFDPSIHFLSSFPVSNQGQEGRVDFINVVGYNDVRDNLNRIDWKKVIINYMKEMKHDECCWDLYVVDPHMDTSDASIEDYEKLVDNSYLIVRFDVNLGLCKGHSAIRILSYTCPSCNSEISLKIGLIDVLK